jgi:hypothetical protein
MRGCKLATDWLAIRLSFAGVSSATHLPSMSLHLAQSFTMVNNFIANAFSNINILKFFLVSHGVNRHKPEEEIGI